MIQRILLFSAPSESCFTLLCAQEIKHTLKSNSERKHFATNTIFPEFLELLFSVKLFSCFNPTVASKTLSKKYLSICKEALCDIKSNIFYGFVFSRYISVVFLLLLQVNSLLFYDSFLFVGKATFPLVD